LRRIHSVGFRVIPFTDQREAILSATYYDHNVHQLLPTAPSRASNFISEDDLNSFEGYLCYQAIDPTTASPGTLASFRETFEEAQKAKAAAPKLRPLKKLRDLKPGEYRYAVVVREGSDLFITLWVRRDPKGDVYVLMPRSRGQGNPHASYHRDGTFHYKSYGRPMAVKKLQPLTGGGFKGCAHLGMFAGHGPKTVGAIYDSTKFTGVLEVPPGTLGPKDGFVAVDLIAPDAETFDLFNPVLVTEEFKEIEPWLVIRVGRQARPNEITAREAPVAAVGADLTM
jgi:hypothetical protein